MYCQLHCKQFGPLVLKCVFNCLCVCGTERLVAAAVGRRAGSHRGGEDPAAEQCQSGRV